MTTSVFPGLSKSLHLNATNATAALQTVELDDKLQYQVLEQILLVVLIVGRWFLPKGDISREQLSQILLAYLAISSDIVEFFDVFKEVVVYQNLNLQYIVLSAWTLSLLQFPFILTVSRARKIRVAVTNEETGSKRNIADISQVSPFHSFSITLLRSSTISMSGQ